MLIKVIRGWSLCALMVYSRTAFKTKTWLLDKHVYIYIYSIIHIIYSLRWRTTKQITHIVCERARQLFRRLNLADRALSASVALRAFLSWYNLTSAICFGDIARRLYIYIYIYILSAKCLHCLINKDKVIGFMARTICAQTAARNFCINIRALRRSWCKIIIAHHRSRI